MNPHSIEIPHLQDEVCLHCGQNFVYHFRANKTNFKPKDTAYYQLDEKLYLHIYCWKQWVLKTSNDKQQLWVLTGLTNKENHQLTEIRLLDRQGLPITQMNYVKQVKKILYNEAERRFVGQVNHYFKEHIHFSFHCSSYQLKKEREAEFMEKKNNFTFRGLKMKSTVTPEYVANYLSR